MPIQGPVNPWVMAQDTLLQTLAQREAAAQLMAEKARRAQLDAEERAERQQSYELQRQQVESTLAGRTAAQEAEKRRRDAIARYRAAPQELRGPIAEELALEHGIQIGHPQMEEIETVDEEGNPVTRFVTPKPGESFRKPAPKVTPTKPELVEMMENGRLVKKWVMPTVGESYQQYQKPEGTGGPKLPEDNPRFPTGVRSWVDEMIALGNPLDATMATVMRELPNQRAKHPYVDAGEVMKYVKNFYSTDQYRDPLVGGGGETEDPALRSQAIERLTQGGYVVNDATVAEAMKRLRGAGGTLGGAPAPARPAVAPRPVGGPLSQLPAMAPTAAHETPGAGPTATTFLPPRKLEPVGSRETPVGMPSLGRTGHTSVAAERPGAPTPPRWQPTPAQRERAIQLLKVNGLLVNDATIAEMVQVMLKEGIR